jgi:hypothetical protein
LVSCCVAFAAFISDHDLLCKSIALTKSLYIKIKKKQWFLIKW